MSTQQEGRPSLGHPEQGRRRPCDMPKGEGADVSRRIGLPGVGGGSLADARLWCACADGAGHVSDERFTGKVPT